LDPHDLTHATTMRYIVYESLKYEERRKRKKRKKKYLCRKSILRL